MREYITKVWASQSAVDEAMFPKLLEHNFEKPMQGAIDMCSRIVGLEGLQKQLAFIMMFDKVAKEAAKLIVMADGPANDRKLVAENVQFITDCRSTLVDFTRYLNTVDQNTLFTEEAAKESLQEGCAIWDLSGIS